jgi:hypothetical protein
MTHRRRTAKRRISVAGAVAIVALCSSVQAQAGTARVSWTIPSTGDAGVPIPFNWTATGVPTGSRVVVQRQQGVARVWRTVIKLPNGPKGSARLGGLALGAYHVRIAVVDRRGKVKSPRTRHLLVFGKVPFSRLFAGTPGVGDGVQPFATGTFHWAIGLADAETAKHNSCRSAHFDFLSISDAPPAGTVTLTTTQESLDPVSTTVPINTVGSLDARVVPGESWAFKFTHDGFSTQGTYALDIYTNGFAVCSSAAPAV